MIKLRVRVFLLSWAYHWVQLVDALLGIVTFGLVDNDLAGRIVVYRWFEAHNLLEADSESWDDPDDPSEEHMDVTIYD